MSLLLMDKPEHPTATIDHLRHEIAIAADVREVKDIRDKLDTLRHWVKSSGQNLFQLNDIAEMKVRAEWQGGKLLREIERSDGGRPKENSSDAQMSFSSYQTALRDAGLKHDTAHRWQVMSFVSGPQLEEYFSKQREKGQEIT